MSVPGGVCSKGVSTVGGGLLWGGCVCSGECLLNKRSIEAPAGGKVRGVSALGGVSASGGGAVCCSQHALRQTPLREAELGIRSMSGRYASYWNAFLFCLIF